MYNNSSNAFAAYQENSVLTASKEKLLLMLYDGAIKFLRFARISVNENNIESTNNYLTKTQRIITELMCTLNMDIEISKSLFSLYEYMNYRLVQANIKKDNTMIDEVLEMLTDLRNTWEKAMA